MFFKKHRVPAICFKPDLTKITLYNGAYYTLADDAPQPYSVYTLCEWDEDWDPDIHELAMDCALEILDDYPIVVNCLHSGVVGENVHNEKSVRKYLQSIRGVDFGALSTSAITLTNGPDRSLVASFDHDDDCFQMYFYAYKQLPNGDTQAGEAFVPDVELYFKHLHTRLVIVTENGIDIYADKIQKVCKKYGKTLVVQELPSKMRDKTDFES